jgi:hypothetical protein
VSSGTGRDTATPVARRTRGQAVDGDGRAATADGAGAGIDHGAAALGLLTVVAANARYLSGLRELLDPMLSMDPFYIHMARLPVAAILRQPPAWGPLYALWLKPFVAVLGDPVAVYAANLAALSLGLSVLIFLHLLLLTRRAAIAVGAALVFLISDANVPLASKVSGFTLLVLVAGWTAAALAPPGGGRLSVATATVLAAAYARPELYPAALVLWLVAAWKAWRERRAHGWSAVAWPAGALAAILILALTLGAPLPAPSAGGDRLLDAFREHFAWNLADLHGRWRPYQSVWEQEFGPAQSLREALQANPGAVARHVASNLHGTVRFLLGNALRHYPLWAAAGSPDQVATETWLTTAAILGALAVVALRPPLRRALAARGDDVLLAYAAVAALCLVAASAVYPRPHYLVIPSVLLLLAGAQALALILPAPAAPSWGLRLLAAAACLAVVPRPFVLPSAYAVAGSPFTAHLAVARPVADTIAFLRALHLPRPVHVLTLTDGIGELLGAGFEEVKIWQKGAQPLEAYLRDRHVDVIVTLRLDHENFAVDDPSWTRILLEPRAVGFTRRPVPAHDEIGVFVRTAAP